MTNTIEDLREELFAALKATRNGELAIDRAKAVSDLAQTLINSAKVEVDMIKAVGVQRMEQTGFIGQEARTKVKELPAPDAKPALINGAAQQLKGSL